MFVFASSLFSQDSTSSIRTFMDLQMHPTMHVPYGFFGDGFTYIDSIKPPKLTHIHQFKNVNYADYWKENKGARIIVVGSLTSEWVKKHKTAKAVILEQIRYTNQFAKENSEYFVVAKTPQEVRYNVLNTNKTVIIHSIEGAKKLIRNQEDAHFWADEGVAFITLMHLVDSEYGSAAIRPGLTTTLLNLKGFLKRKKNRGLKEHGKKTIQWLANAGIMTDLTHMESQTRKDALVFMKEHKIPPISTHDNFKAIQNTPRAISTEEILDIYRLNGLMALPISGFEMEAKYAEVYYQNKLDSLAETHGFCSGSIDSYKFMYQELKSFIESNIGIMSDDSTLIFGNLSEEEKVKFAIGFQSDFNGWLNHSTPKYGDKGCFPIEEDKAYEAIELEGLAHPGLLESQWRLLENEGVDLEPIKRASERFLQLWAYFIAQKIARE